MAFAALAVRWLFAIVLAAAGQEKLRHQTRFRQAIGRYQLVPPALIAAVARTVPMVELTLAVALAAGIAPEAASLATACLLLSFAGAMTWNLLRGRRFDCGCGWSASTTIIGPRLVARNIVLAAVVAIFSQAPAVLAAAPYGSPRARQPTMTVTDLVAIPMLVVLSVLVIRLVAMQRDNWPALRRHDGQPLQVPRQPEALR